MLPLLPLVGGGALEEDLLLLLLLLLGEGLLQQLLVVGALKEDSFQLEWVVLNLHGELLLLSTGALIPVMMMFCVPLSFSGMGLSWLFCPVCPVSSVVFGVQCSERDKLLENVLWVAAKELYQKASGHQPAVYAMGENFMESLLLDKAIPAATLKKLFENQMHKNSIREPFLLSCLPAAVLAVYATHYSAFDMQQRPNNEFYTYVKEQVALAHAKVFLTENPSPTVQAFYSHMDQVFAFLPLKKEQIRQLAHPKDVILEKLKGKQFASMPSVQFQAEVSTASKFERFQDRFEPIFEAYEAEYRSFTSSSHTRRGKPNSFDHNKLNELLAFAGLEREEMVHAFQFEEWFFTHFVTVNGEHQEPNANWMSMLMQILSAHDMRPFERLNPNSMLGIYVLCGRISDTSNPNYLPPAKRFNWDSNAAFQAAGVSASAQSKGDIVIKIMTAEALKLGMAEEYLARHADNVMAGMNWLTSPADPSTNTPFSIALLHFQTIVHCLDNAARARVEEEARQRQIEKAKSMKAQFQAEEADRQARIRVTKECSSCHEDFVWYFPKGQNAETYVPVVTEGQLNVDDYCKECLNLLCKHCKGAMCEELAQAELGLCPTCMDITCKFCPEKIQKLDLICVKVCERCHPIRVCNCGQLVPKHNLGFRQCTTCNVCHHCGNTLPSASEQTIRTCNDCLLLFEEL